MSKSINFSRLLSSNLILALFLSFNISAFAITKEQCSLEYQAKVNEILNDKDSAARELSEKVLGQSFQKLAYAHQVFADSSKEQQKEYEKNLDKYINDNYKYSMSAQDVMKHLKEFSNPFQTAINKQHSSSAGADNTTKEKLQALVLFSRGLDDKKYHIEQYEKDALSKFNFKSHGRDVDGWGLFVGDVARNFYQRQFYDNNDKKDDIDKRFSDKKISTYNSDVTDAIKAVKDDILEMAKNMSNECQVFLREVGANTGMCSLTNPFDSPTKDLILNAETILSKINNPDATFIERPVSVHYAGAQFDVEECMISESENNPGTYKVKMKMNFKYIPGADSEDWSMSLFGGDDGHKLEILNDDLSSENFKSNKTLQTFSRNLTFDQVKLPGNNLKSPLEFQFNNKTGEQVKMFTIGKNNYERDFNGNGSKYLISCPANINKEKSPASVKENYAFQAKNENNSITLSLFKDDTPVDFTAPELANSIIEWTLPEGLACEDNLEDKHKLNCNVITEVTTSTKISYELTGHTIDPDRANPPRKGEIDLVVKSQKPISLQVSQKNNIDKQTTTLTATVTGVDGNPDIKWVIDIKGPKGEVVEKQETKTGPSIEVGMFDSIAYKALVAGKEASGEVNNKLSISVSHDGKNSSKEEKVKLKASIKNKEFQGIKGTFSWECDGEPCGTDSDKLTTKRKDKEVSVKAKFKVKEKTFISGPVKLSKLNKDDKKDKKKDNECEEDEDEEGSDPFSTKKVKDCTTKEEKKRFAPKYMPSMQQPLILPASQPYVTPGFN